MAPLADQTWHDTMIENTVEVTRLYSEDQIQLAIRNERHPILLMHVSCTKPTTEKHVQNICYVVSL